MEVCYNNMKERGAACNVIAYISSCCCNIHQPGLVRSGLNQIFICKLFKYLILVLQQWYFYLSRDVHSFKLRLIEKYFCSMYLYLMGCGPSFYILYKN